MDYTCSSCAKNCCGSGETDNLPKNCPCLEIEEQAKIKHEYEDPQNLMIARNAAIVEAEGYCRWTRLRETMEFAKRCGYQKLGIALCLGLQREGKVLSGILRDNGFQVVSIVCKNGSTPKEFLGITEEEKVRPGNYEPMCNPIAQAMLLNQSKTDFNLVLGLCVGHDSLFIKYSDAPVTVFAVKDRVLAHNPLGAIYLAESYYKSSNQMESF